MQATKSWAKQYVYLLIAMVLLAPIIHLYDATACVQTNTLHHTLLWQDSGYRGSIKFFTLDIFLPSYKMGRVFLHMFLFPITPTRLTRVESWLVESVSLCNRALQLTVQKLIDEHKVVLDALLTDLAKV